MLFVSQLDSVGALRVSFSDGPNPVIAPNADVGAKEERGSSCDQ